MKRIIFIFALLGFLIPSNVAADVQHPPKECPTFMPFFDEFDNAGCITGKTLIIQVAPARSPRVMAVTIPVTVAWLTNRWGKPIRVSTNPSILVWLKAKPFNQAIAIDMNGEPGLDILVVRTNVILDPDVFPPSR